MHTAFGFWVRKSFGDRYDRARDVGGFYCREGVKRMFDVGGQCRGGKMYEVGMQTIIYQITPSKWCTERVLIASTGLKPGTIERARRKSWMQGKEYRHYAVEGDPGHYSECLYNIEEIMRWIENQKQPGAKNASSG